MNLPTNKKLPAPKGLTPLALAIYNAMPDYWHQCTSQRFKNKRCRESLYHSIMNNDGPATVKYKPGATTIVTRDYAVIEVPIKAYQDELQASAAKVH